MKAPLPVPGDNSREPRGVVVEHIVQPRNQGSKRVRDGDAEGERAADDEDEEVGVVGHRVLRVVADAHVVELVEVDESDGASDEHHGPEHDVHRL